MKLKNSEEDFHASDCSHQANRNFTNWWHQVRISWLLLCETTLPVWKLHWLPTVNEFNKTCLTETTVSACKLSPCYVESIWPKLLVLAFNMTLKLWWEGVNLIYYEIGLKKAILLKGKQSSSLGSRHKPLTVYRTWIKFHKSHLFVSVAWLHP